MRIATIASAAVLALSTVVLVQVGAAPDEQKIPTNETAMPDDVGRPAGDTLDNAAETEAGAPSTALVNTLDSDSPPVAAPTPN